MPPSSPSPTTTSDAESWNALSAAESPPAISVPIPSSSTSPELLGYEEQGGYGDQGSKSDKGIGFSPSCSPEEEKAARQHTLANPGHGDSVCSAENGGSLNDKGELPHQFSRDQGGNPTHCQSSSTDLSQPRVGSFGSDADLEKGWASSTSKLVNDAEEGQGEFCRVCHLTVDRRSGFDEAIKLGCACKEDLALAHRHCAETWFKIKGDRTCEICGSTATNILQNEESSCMQNRHDGEAGNAVQMQAERCWQNQPLCNMLLVCFILFLIASWLFRATLF